MDANNGREGLVGRSLDIGNVFDVYCICEIIRTAFLKSFDPFQSSRPKEGQRRGGPLVPILAEVDWRASEEFNFHARPDEVERGRRTKRGGRADGRGAEEAHTRFSVDGNGREAMAVRGISSLHCSLGTL